jgi:hypothetical protein
MRKEILENLLSLRFMLSLLLVICLFAASGFVFVGKYRQQSQDYWEETNKNLAALSEQSGQLYKVAFYEQQLLRKPKPLAFCAEGFEKYLPNSFKFNIFSMGCPQVKGRSNFDLARFSDIDLAFIISLILSFIALVFTCSSICGEKEAGTLRLMLAGSVPRYKVLAAKYLGVMLTIGIPLLVGLLVNLIIIISSNVVIIGVQEWLKVFTIILLSFLYLSIFVLLGMFVSSRTGRSANCMVILLLVWVGLVILTLGLGRIISDASGKTPTQAELDRRLAEVKKQSLDDAFSGKFGKNAGVYSSKHRERCNLPATARWKNAETNAENQVFEGHLNKMMTPAIIGRRFTRISPTVLFQCGCETIVGTGLIRFNGLFQQVKQYKENLREYIRSKDSEDNDSLHLICASTQAVRDWKTMSHKPVDFDTVPKFQEQDLGLGESLQLAIWDIGLLVLFRIVLAIRRTVRKEFRHDLENRQKGLFAEYNDIQVCCGNGSLDRSDGRIYVCLAEGLSTKVGKLQPGSG